MQKAKALQIFVVSYDWLEDSLHKGRKVAERKYIWKQVRAERRKQKLMKKLGPQADGKLTLMVSSFFQVPILMLFSEKVRRRMRAREAGYWFWYVSQAFRWLLFQCSRRSQKEEGGEGGRREGDENPSRCGGT